MIQSTFTPGKELIALNQSNYPILIEVFEIDYINNIITFASNIDKMIRESKIYYENKTDRFYFKHFSTVYYLDECMTIF